MSVLARFTKYTTQSEPVITVGIIAAVVLALIDRYLHLTEDDLQLAGLLLVPLVGAVIARLQVYSPATVARIRDAQAPQEPPAP